MATLLLQVCLGLAVYCLAAPFAFVYAGRKLGSGTNNGLAVQSVIVLLGMISLWAIFPHEGQVWLRWIYGLTCCFALGPWLAWIVFRRIDLWSRQGLAALTGVVLFELTALWYTFPEQVNWLVYQFAWFHFDKVIVFVAVAGFAFAAWKAKRAKRTKLAMVVGGIGLAIFVTIASTRWLIGTDTVAWRMARIYRFEKREKLVGTDPKALRFMGQDPTYQKMIREYTRSNFTIEKEQLHPLVFRNGHFGYAAPVTADPDAPFVRIFWRHVGVVEFDDSPGVPEGDRLKFYDTYSYEYGVKKVGPDRVESVVYRWDPFCVISDVIYLPLEPENPKLYTAVARKIGYSWDWTLKRIPYWKGVTLVHYDGKIENLSAAQAVSDSRLARMPIFPIELALWQVDAQRFDRGFWNTRLGKEGILEIPKLPGDNQQPITFQGEDGYQHYVVMVEPQGQSYGLFRLYYINGTTGERSYFEFAADDPHLGPISGIEAVKTALPYYWLEENKSGEHGSFRLPEVHQIVKDNRLFWAAPITSKQKLGVTSLALVDSKDQRVTEFKTREALVDWLTGKAEIEAAPKNAAK